MPHRLPTLIAALLTVLLISTARGQLLGGRLVSGESERVTVRGAIARTPLQPGSENQVIIELAIAPRYHVQSAFAAAPNIPARVTVQHLPPGVEAGAILAQAGLDIPTPPALGTGSLSVYEGKAYFVVPLKVSADAPPGDGTLELTVQTQACNDTTCDPPKTTTLHLTTRIASPGETPGPPDPLLALAQSKTLLPQPTASTSTTRLTTSTATAAIVPAAATLMTTDQQLAAIADRPYQPFNADEHHHSLVELLLFALVGGLILNVMPCVLPVIPLKAVWLIQQSRGSRRAALAHALVFSAGVISLFAVLAVLLRTLGLFYGQQFQSTAFLAAMVMFVVALALSMLGVWTIQPPRAVYAADEKFGHQTGYAGTFSSGLMATLLATPCSAPFLGPVFAWALVHPAWIAALMLALVGVGMSLPYVLLALFPGALALMPRAGRWTELLKQGLGIVMLGVAIYLVTLIPNTRLWLWALMGALVTALACWGWGQIPTVLMSSARIWTIRAVVLAAGLALGSTLWFLAERTARPLPVQWQPFNLALLDQGLQEGRPVIVDWTADWCINCHALEAFVLSREETQRAFQDNHALLLRADLTTDNPEATALNQKLGGEAIPVLAIFAPARPDQPVVLRDGYTTARVIDELRAAK